MSRTSRVVQLTVAALAAVALPVLSAPAASATASQCLKYLEREGFSTDRSHDDACYIADRGFPEYYYFERCVDELLDAGVSAYHSRRACERATW